MNHNIYGGGKIASVVGNNSYITMTKGLLYNSTEMVAGRDTGKNFFESIEWKEIYEKSAHRNSACSAEDSVKMPS